MLVGSYIIGRIMLLMGSVGEWVFVVDVTRGSVSDMVARYGALRGINAF